MHVGDHVPRKQKTQLPQLKPRNKALNDLLMSKSKRGGKHTDKRREQGRKPLRSLVEEILE